MIEMNLKKNAKCTHTGFYTQCGTGLESQRHTQAFTLSVETHRRTHRLLHSVWHRARKPETHAQAFTLNAAHGWRTNSRHS
jgi:hypothetical protein